MGRASELVNRLKERPLQPGELHPLRPDLQVRADSPSIEIDNQTPTRKVVEHLRNKQGGLVVRDDEGEPKAVVLSPERYAELAGCEIESEERFRAFEGRIEPDPTALGELMVEQVDPTAEWLVGSRIWRESDR